MTMRDPALPLTEFELREAEPALTLGRSQAASQHYPERRRPRRNHSPAFKAQIAVAALQGEASVARLAQQFDVHRNQITQWRAQLLERAVELFDAVPEKPARRR
jgi:transposase